MVMSGRDTVLPYFGSDVWVVTTMKISSGEYFEAHTSRELCDFHTSSFVLAHTSFQVTLGFEWNEDRAIASFVLFHPGIFFHLPPHLCQYEQMTQTKRCHYKAILRGLLHRLTGQAALCLLAWLPLFSSSPLFFLQFSFEQRPAKGTTLCWIVQWGNSICWCLLSPDCLITF